MISVLVLGFSTASGRAPVLADTIRTLTALVPGTVEGTIRDVVLLATGAHPELAKVADHAGCTLIEARGFEAAIQTGAKRARCDLLLVLPAGVTFDRSLTDELAEAAVRFDGIAQHPGVGLRSVESGFLARLLPGMAATVGVLASRDRILGAKATSFAVFVRACGPTGWFKTRVWAGE